MHCHLSYISILVIYSNFSFQFLSFFVMHLVYLLMSLVPATMAANPMLLERQLFERQDGAGNANFNECLSPDDTPEYTVSVS